MLCSMWCNELLLNLKNESIELFSKKSGYFFPCHHLSESNINLNLTKVPNVNGFLRLNDSTDVLEAKKTFCASKKGPWIFKDELKKYQDHILSTMLTMVLKSVCLSFDIQDALAICVDFQNEPCKISPLRYCTYSSFAYSILLTYNLCQPGKNVYALSFANEAGVYCHGK